MQLVGLVFSVFYFDEESSSISAFVRLLLYTMYPVIADAIPNRTASHVQILTHDCALVEFMSGLLSVTVFT